MLFCFHSLSCSFTMNPQVEPHALTTRPPSPLRPWGEGGGAGERPVRPLGLLLASSLPNYSTHLLSPTSRRRSDDSRVRRLRITEKQQLGLPAAHPHPQGLKCNDVVLMFGGGGGVAAQCSHAGIILQTNTAAVITLCV